MKGYIVSSSSQLIRPRFLLTVVLTSASISTLFAGTLLTEWDVSPLYGSQEAWDSAKQKIPAKVDALQRFKGRLGDGPDSMKAMLDEYFSLLKELDRLYVYANMVSDLDVREPGPLGRKQELAQMDSEVSATTSWIDPEILSLPADTIYEYLEKESGLAPYERYFERLETQRLHILDPRGEEILGLAGMIQGDGRTIGSILRNAEMTWRNVTFSDGTDLKVDVIGYSRGRARSNR
ncbi:MAG: hypothetical protein ACWGQW_24930, partial [bacterium]